MTNTIKTLTLIAFLSALAACGGSDNLDSETEAEAEAATEKEVLEETGSGSVIIDTASEVVTTLADVNGFKIVPELYNVNSASSYGTEVTISAHVKDRSNNPVEDGTVITFVADDHGYIENQCATVKGYCEVVWTSAGDRSVPGDPNAVTPTDQVITIMARTIGSDSFIDKNSNSKFDTNETWFTQSEPYIDANDDGDYDAGLNEFDEFFDYNDNGVFDLDSVFTKFRGASCSDAAIAAGHCAGRIEVWDSISMSDSDGGKVKISLYEDACKDGGAIISDGTQIDISGGAAEFEYCIILQDPNGNVPPSGTKISVTPNNGEEIGQSPTEINNVRNAVDLIGIGYAFDVKLKSDGTASQDDSLVIEITPLDGVAKLSRASFPIKD